uniref:Uncharacterized protein n=1 Tax=Oryza barthii TaxID=65489 RepID=A0A0D3FIB7_9ORYZ
MSSRNMRQINLSQETKLLCWEYKLVRCPWAHQGTTVIANLEDPLTVMEGYHLQHAVAGAAEGLGADIVACLRGITDGGMEFYISIEPNF